MKIIHTIIEDWQNNWGSNISYIGLFILVGMVSYNAGFTNGMVYLCQTQNGTLVEHISDEIYCDYTYIEPVSSWNAWENTTINLEGLNGLQPITIQ